MNPRQWSWGDYATIDGIVVNGGSGNGDRHIVISAREMARLGQLFLHRGQWNGVQLIRSEWIDRATSVEVPADIRWAHPVAGLDGRGVYGLNWWVNGVKPDGERKWPEAPVGTYAASGYNNNKLFVIPEWNIVLVRLGLDQPDLRISDKTWSVFLGKLRASLVD